MAVSQHESLKCLYYQAHVVPLYCWYVTAILRSYEHVCFDRTLDKQASILEFFVPESQERTFNKVMNYFIAQGQVVDLKKLSNRLAQNS